MENIFNRKECVMKNKLYTAPEADIAVIESNDIMSDSNELEWD